MPVIKAFNDIKARPFPRREGIAGLADLRRVAAIEVGAGSKAFKADQSGIWLGGKRWADAPFRVDMLGNLIASSATFPNLVTISIFKQDSIPTSTAIGDLWFDTNDDNKPYVAASVGADEIAEGEWELVDDQRAADALLKAGAAQTLSGDFQVGGANVKIDGANNRIVINDGTNDRILMGFQSGGF